jgi:hypothetical protein
MPQANRGQDWRQIRVAELDFGFSCTECTESAGRTSKAGFSESVRNMGNQRERLPFAQKVNSCKTVQARATNVLESE